MTSINIIKGCIHSDILKVNIGHFEIAFRRFEFQYHYIKI